MIRTRLNLMGLTLLVLAVLMGSTPAWAGWFDWVPGVSSSSSSYPLQIDVACGNGLRLQRASGVPGGGAHTYIFRGFCSLVNDMNTGERYVFGHPPLSATARWNKASGTYTETLHFLAPETISSVIPNIHVGTGPEEATFKCDVDPVINRTSHCTLITQSNNTGWGGQNDGFAWQALHNKPLLAGRATAAQAESRSRHSARIDCRGLHLVDATGVPNGMNSWYRFEGTCRLYHTKSGSQGLQVTQVEVFGDWDSTDMQTHEGVIVDTDSSEGGGSWRTTYTCNEDPWIHRNAQCSKTAQSGVAAQVYDPITDLMARHPVTLGMANASQAAKLSQLSKARHTAQATKLAQLERPRVFSGHKSMALSRRSHPPSLPKPKLTIRFALASPANNCDPNRLLKVNVVIRNSGGPLPAHTRFAYVHAVEPGGAHLTGPNVSLPAISSRETWQGVLAIGTRKSFFPKLPGRHTLLVSIGPDHAAVGTLAYIPPLPFRATVNFPAGYCQQLRYRNIGALMRGATRGAIHGTTRGKPTVGLRHGMQQRGVRKKLVPTAPVRKMNLHGATRGKPTAGLRHATQQRGVQKKLTPVTPALRFAPTAPVRRLNLPARPGLNR